MVITFDDVLLNTELHTYDIVDAQTKEVSKLNTYACTLRTLLVPGLSMRLENPARMPQIGKEINLTVRDLSPLYRAVFKFH